MWKFDFQSKTIVAENKCLFLTFTTAMQGQQRALNKMESFEEGW